VTLVGFRNYLAVVKGKVISVNTAWKWLLVSWIFAFGGTVLTSRWSTIYLMASGTSISSLIGLLRQSYVLVFRRDLLFL
jgi:hypothetical protein